MSSRRWWPGSCFLLLILVAAGWGTWGCARPVRPGLLPPGETAEDLWRELARGCREISDYEAQGRLTISRERWVMEARERVLCAGPDRIRLLLRYRGFLGMFPTELDILQRGDSIYVEARPGMVSWRGTRQQLRGSWPREGPLFLAALEELGPAGPIDCETPAASVLSRPPPGARHRGSRELALRLAPETSGATWRVVWVGRDERVPVASELYAEGSDGERLLAEVNYGEYGVVGNVPRPSFIRAVYPEEEAVITLRHESQWANVGLADTLFDPACQPSVRPGAGEGP